jgi:hypothetical protein
MTWTDIYRNPSAVAAAAMVLVTICISSPAFCDDEIPIRRFAYIVGANNGGYERPPLRYANTDAASVAEVLVELGGVRRNDLILITDGTRNALVDGFTRMTRMLNSARKNGDRTELVFYYSGHSDEKGLLLENDVYTYQEIKQQIDKLPAWVRIGILDSCASGTLVRTKGGRRTAPFLVDASSEVKGVAILTSSSADEVAQESDRIGGSYFTHFLVSGMRGAADENRDGRVTLNESYTYAFDETLHRTTDTQAGAQHPNYDFRLAGAGDFVLTDLRSTNGVILFAPEVKGRIYVRDENGNLIAEINKTSDRPIKLGVQPGNYEVAIDSSHTLRKGIVRVTGRSPTRINGESLRVRARHTTVARGDAAPKATHRDEADKWTQFRPVAVGFLPGVSTNGAEPTLNAFALNLLGRGHSLRGLEVGIVGNIRTGIVSGMQVSAAYNYAANLRGFQAGLVNISSIRTVGFQSGLINIGHTVHGFQTGLVNINQDVFNGFQTGLVNVTADMSGVQAGLINHQWGEMRGLEMGLINRSASLFGMQIGLINSNRYVMKGAQMGLVNHGNSGKGIQMGLVNIARGDFTGPQIGLFNYAAKGLFAPTCWMSDTAGWNLALKMGNRYTYKILGMSQKSWLSDKHNALVAGIGLHLEFHPLWTEIDALYIWTLPDDDDEWENDAIAKLRWSLGFRFFDQFSAYAGFALNNLISDTRKSVGRSPALTFIQASDGDINYELSLGMFVGLQWEPKWRQHNTWRGRRYTME